MRLEVLTGLSFIERTIVRSAAFKQCLPWVLIVLNVLLVGCGGGRSNSLGPTASSSQVSVASSSPSQISSTSGVSISSPNSSAQQNGSSVASMMLTGRATYDFVPHNTNHIGLNYSATETRAGRGLVVELLDQSNLVLATTVTNNNGDYALPAELDKLVRVRVKAQLFNSSSPSWNFRVTDNTSSNSLYVMDGSLLAANQSTQVRNLHAASGWGGSGYTATRVAAPFAILDSVLIGVNRLVASVSNNALPDFPSLELRWSTRNKPVDGNLFLGEIGTSFYCPSLSLCGGNAIYILGDENNDIDEYDRHIILHEWGHYIEDHFSRSDSIGGSHGYGEKLDLRVSMSEGLANAFSGMMLDDPIYRDVSGTQEADGFFFNISRKTHTVRGYYSEASVESILYNFYVAADGKVSRDFADIFNVMRAPGYAQNPAVTSIYSFANELRGQLPNQINNFDTLLSEQNIAIANEYGAGENNSGGYVGSLPIYTSLTLNNAPVNVCSTNQFGSYNKLAVSRFLTVNVVTAGIYQFSVQKSEVGGGVSDPDLVLYNRGVRVGFSGSAAADQEQLSLQLFPGVYLLEVYDARAREPQPNTATFTACFDVRAQQLN